MELGENANERIPDLSMLHLEPADQGTGGRGQLNRLGAISVHGFQKSVQKILLDGQIVEAAEIVLERFQLFD